VYELWQRTYPRDVVPHSNLGGTFVALGRYGSNLAETREALRLDPEYAESYADLLNAYLYLDKQVEAGTTADQMVAKRIEAPSLHLGKYKLGFLQNDPTAMKVEVAWADGRSGTDSLMLANEANTAAFFGQLRKSREYCRRAVALAEVAEQRETAATYEADAALRDALFGNQAESRRTVAAARRLSTGRDVQYGIALALALVGDTPQAKSLADDLSNRFAEDTVVRFNYLPTIRAQVSLIENNPSKAIDALESSSPYDLGIPGNEAFALALYPVFVRAKAYQAAHQGSAAVAEYQKIIDHRGLVLNEPIGALAHLGLARAYAMQGDTAKARAAYEDFLTLWKDADADIPILITAKAEYAKVK
jgi:eukaryotic-like serine/threonine-protein kinase